MKKIYILFGIILLSSCKLPKEDKKNDVEVYDDIEVNYEEETIDKRAHYNPSRTILTDLVHTKLEVNFDWNKSRMNGVETLTVKPHFYDTDSLILDAKGMDIHSIKLNGSQLTYTYDSLVLRIKLDKNYTRKDQYTVEIKYTAKPDERETGGSAAITSDKGLYFINPKGEVKNQMPQIWTQGETEASSVWFPTIDSPNSKTTQEIYITVDQKYTTLSNGKLISQTKNADGTRTDYWKQTLPHAPYLFMMGVGEFKIVKDNYKKPDGSNMEINYYVEPEWESSAKAIFGETPNMIAHFSKLLGYDYPWDKYSQIVVRDYVSGAMENTGAVVFGDYVYKNERELLDGNDQSTIAHELFHHWFGDLVTCESWSNLPLNESFANYSQYLWDEHRYGKDEADYQAEEEAKGYFQSAAAQGYHNLIWFDYDDKEQMFDGHSYNKGGRILHMLRAYIGDEAFFAGITNYLKTNQFKPAEYNQLRIAFEEVCGEDLNWFFDQWFLAAGHPVLNVTQQVDSLNNNVTVEFSQNQDLKTSPIFKLPMEVAIFDDKGKTTYKIVVDQIKQSFIFPVNGKLNCVIPDFQQVILGNISDLKSQEQSIYQYYHGENWKARKNGFANGSKGTSENAQSLVLNALNDKFWSIRQDAISKCGKLTGMNKTKAMLLIENLATNDPNSSVRRTAIMFLANNIEVAKFDAICENSIKNDQSYMVINAALSSIAKSNPSKAMTYAKTLESEKSSKMMAGIGQLYANHGTKDNFGFFENTLNQNKVKGFDELSIMNSLTYFIEKCNDIEIAEKSYPLFKNLFENGGMYTKMFFPQNINFLIESFQQKITALNTELEAYEKNNDAALADQTRKKIDAYQSLLTKYSSLMN